MTMEEMTAPVFEVFEVFVVRLFPEPAWLFTARFQVIAAGPGEAQPEFTGMQ